MKTGRYNLKELLTHNEIEQIIIPEIQRDYVWQPEHVKKLISSIFTHYGFKKNVALSIHIGSEPLNQPAIEQYLQNEYEKLIFNVKIGFIYAYHDNEYPGKFFLIDGQQRLTTLYLLLLALYVKSDNTEDFRKIYFDNNTLKVDYKVREASHDFMLEFIKHKLNKCNGPIKESAKYYSEYDDDITVKNIIGNYQIISETIAEWEKSLDVVDFKSLLSFLEEYVEFNYFDTNLSEQGEQLYLYMNSRGESLSPQEQIKPAIMEKEKDQDQKYEVGEEWEEWQNFFWLHRGENENADIGFQEFLKWATVIHLCAFENGDCIIKKTIKDKGKERQQSLREAKANYIHRRAGEIKDQQALLSDYQIKNKMFKFDYLGNIFRALNFLFDIKEKVSLPIKEEWLSNNKEMRALDYVILLPLIYYSAQFEWDDDNEKLKDIKRFSKFLQNITYFRSGGARSPDLFTVEAIDIAKAMFDNNSKDIICFLDPTFNNTHNTILTEGEKFKLHLLQECQDRNDTDLISREKLEEFIWNITDDDSLSKFIEGDISILFDCVNKELNLQSPSNHINNNYLAMLKVYRDVFKSVVFEYNESNLLRRALLTYDDYKLHDGGGSGYYGPWIQKFSFIQRRSDNREWRMIFKQNSEIIYKLLKDIKDNLLEDSQLNLKSHLEGRCDGYSSNGKEDNWKELFIKYPELFDYCQNNKILYENENRIMLLSSIQAQNAREIQIMLFHILLEGSVIKTFNSCYLEFNIENGQEVHSDEHYTLEIQYINSEWRVELSYSKLSYTEQKLKVFLDNGWKKVDDKENVIKKIDILYNDDTEKSIMDNVNEVKFKIMNLIQKIKSIYLSNQT